jgi:hypothetical protein
VQDLKTDTSWEAFGGALTAAEVWGLSSVLAPYASYVCYSKDSLGSVGVLAGAYLLHTACTAARGHLFKQALGTRWKEVRSELCVAVAQGVTTCALAIGAWTKGAAYFNGQPTEVMAIGCAVGALSMVGASLWHRRRVKRDWAPTPSVP